MGDVGWKYFYYRCNTMCFLIRRQPEDIGLILDGFGGDESTEV
ncbi:MAG: hypothetical protein CM1200mP15_18910 [Dehalococcoidia bacterium]|nr:MAG: hypothetical protein CM1200mP15_18910 [Dehalococcoidia bacterium]